MSTKFDKEEKTTAEKKTFTNLVKAAYEYLDWWWFTGGKTVSYIVGAILLAVLIISLTIKGAIEQRQDYLECLQDRPAYECKNIVYGSRQMNYD